MVRILLMNIPSGPFPTYFPPVAISRVIDGLDPSLQCDVSFLNLDYHRPDFEEIKNRIQAHSPHVIGFSAILTPSYRYLKELSILIKEHFPDIIQVLGGEMSVIANIILLKTKIDFCCIGESEPVFSNLLRRLKKDNFKPDMENYMNIKGLAFLKDKVPFFTGYEERCGDNALYQFNYRLMSEIDSGSLSNYIYSIDSQHFRTRVSDVKDLLNMLYPHNRSKNLAPVFASNGCINRCTFCHRYSKGYMTIDVDKVISYIEALKKDCDIGMVMFMEENFGTNAKATARLVEYLKTTGINWIASAVRVRTVNEHIIKSWKEAGCVYIGFGIESLSQKMLDVMEKKATVEENLNAIRLCLKYGIFTAVNLLIGMPGETDKTIQETVDNLSTLMPDNLDQLEFGVNHVQTVPGTPVYEYAKRLGLIGQSLDEEERYIESLHEIAPDRIKHSLNYTDCGKEEATWWFYYLLLEFAAASIKKHGFLKVVRHKKTRPFTRPFRAGLVYALFPRGIRKFLLKYLIILKFYGAGGIFRVITKKLSGRGVPEKFSNINISLRKILHDLPLSLREDEVSIAVLRDGRR